jgi:WD40 repeat protein
VTPTALAVNQIHDKVEISVGMGNGHFSLFLLNLQTSQLDLLSSHAGCNGAITAMALSSPYLLMVSQYKNLTLYNLHHDSSGTGEAAEATKPCQLASLKADNIVAPMTLSLRVSPFDIVATIVYSFFHIGCGWSLGIQELRLGKDGQQLDSRLTTTVDSQYGVRPLQGLQSRKQRQHSAVEPDESHSSMAGGPYILHQQPPTSMSYSHPYLLTSHADNTLTMYLVVSTAEKLFVQGGRRLWGHTSSVSAVQVTNRGKAVSVSSRGNDIRIWELETAISSLGTRKAFKEDSGIQLSAGNKGPPELEPPRTLSQNLNSDLEANSQLLSRMQGCIGFDEERVLLLREKGVGAQLLECYDFT